MTSTTVTSEPTQQLDVRLRNKVLDTLAKHSFCTLATASPAGRPHVAGVVYEFVDGALWVHTSNISRKARNIAANPEVGICVVYRKLPVGPPFTVHFQARAEVVGMGAAEPQALLAAGRLKSISGHGALDMKDGCFLRVSPNGRLHSFGPGARTIDLIRDPIATGGRTFSFDDSASV